MFPEEQFGLSDEFCSNIEDYRNTTAYDRVESEVRRSVGSSVSKSSIRRFVITEKAPY